MKPAFKEIWRLPNVAANPQSVPKETIKIQCPLTECVLPKFDLHSTDTDALELRVVFRERPEAFSLLDDEQQEQLMQLIANFSLRMIRDGLKRFQVEAPYTNDSEWSQDLHICLTTSTLGDTKRYIADVTVGLPPRKIRGSSEDGEDYDSPGFWDE